MSAEARLQKEYIRIQKEKIPYVFTVPDSSNWLIWHFVIHSLSSPYSEGVYYGQLEFTPTYPWSPPSMKLITPNGRFESNKTICTTHSNYHPESWTPAWSVRTILIGLVSHMLGSDGGVGTISSSNLTKSNLAKNSMAWNMNDNKFLDVFAEYLNLFSNFEAVVEVDNKNRLKTKLIDSLPTIGLIAGVAFLFILVSKRSSLLS